jgi:hypothetical protein
MDLETFCKDPTLSNFNNLPTNILSENKELARWLYYLHKKKEEEDPPLVRLYYNLL